ncbi:MAG: hypothetical protein AAFO61_10615 [Pseudomonadota bacterium]
MVELDVVARQIEKKESEIRSLEKKLSEARVYVQALHDLMKVMETDEAENAAAEGTIREGSAVDQARKAILQAGKALHLDEILAAIGRESTRETKASLNGSLAAYVRRNEIFTRPKPSTYGLVEISPKSHDEPSHLPPEPPQGFGGYGSHSDEDIPF